MAASKRTGVLALAVVVVALTSYVASGRQSVAGVFDSQPHGALSSARSDKPGVRVLFIGNSYTNNNDMTHTVSRLAEADALALFAVAYGPSGKSLQDHVADTKLAALVSSVRWDYVVLQEQSQRISFLSADRRLTTDPYLRQMVERVRANGS